MIIVLMALISDSFLPSINCERVKLKIDLSVFAVNEFLLSENSRIFGNVIAFSFLCVKRFPLQFTVSSVMNCS